MFRWLRAKITGTKLSPPKETTEREGEMLTDYEVDLMLKTERCPDCGTGRLAKGPEGGMSQNCACEHCGSEFNWMGPMGGERISDRGPRDLGDRAALYRLPQSPKAKESA